MLERDSTCHCEEEVHYELVHVKSPNSLYFCDIVKHYFSRTSHNFDTALCFSCMHWYFTSVQATEYPHDKMLEILKMLKHILRYVKIFLYSPSFFGNELITVLPMCLC